MPINFLLLFLHYTLLLQIKWVIRGNKEGCSLRVQERFIAGSLAGTIAQTIIYPMEVSLKFVLIPQSLLQDKFLSCLLYLVIFSLYVTFILNL